MQLAEPPFGTIKREMGLRSLSAQRPGESPHRMELITLAYNFKRVLNLVSFEKLMAAVA